MGSDKLTTVRPAETHLTSVIAQAPRGFRTPPPPRVRTVELGVLDYWRVLVKRKWTVLTTLVAVVTVAAIITFRTTPSYEAVGRIAVYRDNSDMLGFKSEGTQGSRDDEDYVISMATHVRVFSSDTTAMRVVQKLALDKNPKFAGGGDPNTSGTQSSLGAAARDASLIGTLKRGLKVAVIPNTRLIEIRYLSPDPRLAAEIVNALSAAYVEQNMKTKFESTTQAAEWLSRQLSDLQVKVEASEQKLVEYQKVHGIVGLDEKQNIITSKLDELNRELTAAEADRIQKQARYQLGANPKSEMPTGAGDSSLLQTLTAQRAQLATEAAKLNTQLGPSHPKVVELRSQLKQLESEIDKARETLTSRARADYLTALERERMLRSALEAQKQVGNELNESAIEYTLLKRDAESNRKLYDGLLQKLKEAGVAAGLQSSNVRIVDVARVPIVPAKPNIPRNMTLALMLGCISGIVLGLVREAFDTSIRNLEEVESISGLPVLGMIPMDEAAIGNSRAMVKRIAVGAEAAAQSEPTALAVQAVTLLKPRSATAEAFRALRTALLLSSPEGPPQTILITSALPQEGKTTTALNTAIVLSQQGASVLLVDADMRRPRLHSYMGVKNTRGLSSVLSGGATWSDCVVKSPEAPNITVLPAGPSPPHAADLIASKALATLLKEWSSTFDFIVIDSPPVLQVTDAVLLSVHMDAVLLVLRSATTPKNAIRHMRELLTQVGSRVLGVVVNGVDQRDPCYYYGYYDSKYGNGYYHES